MGSQYARSSWMRPRMTGGAFDAQRIQNKAPFMATVIAVVVLQLAVTFFVMEKLSGSDRYQTWARQHLLFLIFLLLAPLVLILLLAFVPMPMHVKFFLFTLFSVCFGMLLAITRRLLTPELLRMALLCTIGIFVSMFIVGLFLAGFGYDLFWLGAILFFLLILMLMSGLVLLVMHPDEKIVRIRAALVVFLFAAYVMYDTNQILMRDYAGDYITASIDYYLDFVNIFVHLLEILGNTD